MSEALSYFEYTTLLALVVFEDCDLMVLEAGLGGEYDATNVCDKELSVFTPIGIDHQAFLGETIEEIASTKLRSMQHRALLAPQPYPKVETVAKEIAADKGAEIRVCKPGVGAPLVGAFEAYDPKRLETLARTKGWPDFLVQNARVAIAALAWMEIPFDVETLRDLELFGRFYPWRENVRIDVGHNPLAARAIVEALSPQTVLIYNALSDKDAPEVLRILAPKLKRVEIIPIETERATDIQRLETAIDAAGLPYRTFKNILSPDEHYLVFGSFYVVEAFLKN
jgi:dihydrofolate synthase/folylpolyglutamate synthase